MRTYSETTCKVSYWLTATSGTATQNQVALVSLDRFLAIKYSGYLNKLLLNKWYPIGCTIGNYILCGILSYPITKFVSLNFEMTTCSYFGEAGSTLDQIYFYFVTVFVFMLLPLCLIMFCNIYTIIRRLAPKSVTCFNAPFKDFWFKCTVGSTFENWNR